MIFAGSDSFTSCEHEKLIIGPKINASTVWSMLSASSSSSLEKRQSHQTVELIKCAFDSQQWFPKWNKNIKKKESWEFSLRSRNCVFDFCRSFTLLRTKWQFSIYKFYSKAVISLMLIHHTKTSEYHPMQNYTVTSSSPQTINSTKTVSGI